MDHSTQGTQERQHAGTTAISKSGVTNEAARKRELRKEQKQQPGRSVKPRGKNVIKRAADHGHTMCQTLKGRHTRGKMRKRNVEIGRDRYVWDTRDYGHPDRKAEGCKIAPHESRQHGQIAGEEIR